MKKIKKAVFPVAGLGTRFLPATKASPKEMLPVVDKPLIQYAAEEAIDAGINHLIFVIGRTKNAIINHFDPSPKLEEDLRNKKKLNLSKLIKKIVPKNVNCTFVRQEKPLGLGHAIYCAKKIIGNSDFAVILADDLIKSKIPT
ncbi:MAG: sugar phosphate nucleotidyltransferase, partial [Pseudomonadota bacterium]|nr:sugar phosphate nucleotidyltransferase [Pseudomonadota bacterium]